MDGKNKNKQTTYACICIGGLQRDIASTKVFIALGWQSFWIVCEPEITNSNSFSVKACKN